MWLSRISAAYAVVVIVALIGALSAGSYIHAGVDAACLLLGIALGVISYKIAVAPI